MRMWGIITAWLFLALAAWGQSTAVAGCERQSLDDAWWTGPMLAPSANTLPRGHILVEPYLFDVISYSRFDANGNRRPVPRSHGFGNLTYINYGVTDRFTMGLIPTAGYNVVNSGLSSDHVGLGDVSMAAQYRLTTFREGHRLPTISVAVQEKFPTGRYDQLGARPAQALGAGAHTISLSLYTQYFFWLPNGRIVRTRFNATQSFWKEVSIRDASVYGTADGFRGTAAPGRSLVLDSAWEFSVTRRFVLATDLTYEHDETTRVSGMAPVSSSSTLVPVAYETGASDAFGFAPAVEYNFNSRVGVLLGVRLFPAGRNTSASITPAIAINIVR